MVQWDNEIVLISAKQVKTCSFKKSYGGRRRILMVFFASIFKRTNPPLINFLIIVVY